MTTVDRRRLPILTPEYRVGQHPPNFGRKYPPEVLTAEEIRGLMEHCGRGRGRAFVRNRAWIALAAATGLRISESLDLLPSDVDWEHGIVHVREGKNRRARRVGIDAASLAVVGEWRDERRGLGVPLGTPLFCTFAQDDFGPVGRPMWHSYVRDMLKRAARHAGVEKRVHCHAMRHTFAFRLMLAGVDLLTISLLLGHKSTAYTDAYLRHIAPLREVAQLQQLPSPEWLRPRDTGVELVAA